ncbi:hypothetical protein CPB84DRAFT_1844351 [Gymnopilus junonius]|uniref:DNA topoisomerase I n=1 Tax=Gymnopilus junonius TaxID=109634 RepID=A0A9P5TRW2_GYMJU|nr:hypothetical protein CPB84DRAFT_1844351 [Gymnopilus junonius]
MTSETAVALDKERPSSGLNGHGRNAQLNGNHTIKDEDVAMSEDDLPLSQTTRRDATSIPPRSLKRKKPVYAESSSEDDTPLASSPAKPAKANGKGKPKQEPSESTVVFPTDDASNNRGASNGRVSKPARKKVKEESDSASDQDEDDQSLESKSRSVSRKRKVKAESGSDVHRNTSMKPRKKVKQEEDGSEAEAPKPKRARKTKGDTETKSPSKPRGKKKEEQDQDQDQKEVFRWWENNSDPNGDGSVKWTTLEHNGVIFPPPYEPLPSTVKMKYNGKSTDLPPEAEEVAGFYAALLETEHARDATFNKNFFDDWKTVMKKHPPRDGTKITSFDLCDFRPMFEHFEAEKAKKKAMTGEEKKAAKKAKDEMEAKYTTCLLDGRKEKVGNFRVEPPGLFRGRGDHPKKGALKFRVRPEDITLNIGEGAPIPVPNMPGKWKAIQYDNTVTWLANWTENINGNHKYVFLAAGSSLKGQSDMQKFEKARELKNHVDRIRQNYTVDLKSKVMADRQRATAMYFIDKLALRAGNEKGEDEADTVGCCSLRCEHVTLESPDFIIFDFLGKDSIRYYNRVQVDPQVFKNIRIFKDNKNDDDNLFDRVTTTSLNKHLTSEMKGLTAKVFRTFNASFTFQRLLDEEDLANATLQEKLNVYNKANRKVAILCNHQRSAPKTHDQSMEKMRYKHRSFKYERMKLRHALFKLDPKHKKNAKYKDDESDLDDDWIIEHENNLKLKEIEKAEKKFVKENEKLQEESEAPQKDSVLRERLDDIEEEFNRLAKERGTSKATLKRDRPEEKLEESIDKLTEKIKAFKLQIVDRDEGKEVALGTSKINYLDPRITAAWCQIHDFPIEKIFSKTLVAKFPWAMEVEKEWKF